MSTVEKGMLADQGSTVGRRSIGIGDMSESRQAIGRRIELST